MTLSYFHSDLCRFHSKPYCEIPGGDVDHCGSQEIFPNHYERACDMLAGRHGLHSNDPVSKGCLFGAPIRVGVAFDNVMGGELQHQYTA